MSTSTIAIPFVNSRPPTWASGYGQDKYGYFAEFSVSTGSQYWDVVTQRMRWIPPGVFQMGAADGEPTFIDSETRHEVILSRGYWLADTACSQTLWSTVVGENPSHFSGDDLPVERVSYEDVIHFLSELRERVPGLDPVLPTEAQWECGCRAGTEGPFSFGDTISTDQVNFDGNHSYGDSPKGDYRQKTVGVQALRCNAWGLYQMHGNVWEWCSDWYRKYSPDSAVDPSGPEAGSNRVVRGGSWFNLARNVRSAYRLGNSPGNRNDYLGFRLLSSASQAKSDQSNVVSASRTKPRDEAVER